MMNVVVSCTTKGPKFDYSAKVIPSIPPIQVSCRPAKYRLLWPTKIKYA